MDDLFCYFYCEQGAKQAADDRFIGIEVQQDMFGMNERHGVFQCAYQPGEEECSESGANNYPGTIRVVDPVLLPVSQK